MNKKIEKLKNERLKFKHLLLLFPVLIPLIGVILLALTLSLGYWYLVLAYLTYFCHQLILGVESKSNNKHRDNFCFNIIKEYFDMKIVKTADIPPTKNYMFCYHPHGIVPFGMFSALNSNCCGFDELYPGINLNPKSHSVNLSFPLFREIGLYFGAQYVTKKSIMDTLSKPGSSVAINIGGGAEMVYAVPNTAKLIVKNRFGFVKIALETGSDLVPIYGFGENSAYDQSLIDQNSNQFWLKRLFYKKTNFFWPSITGRGILPNTKGIFPNNVPIRIVVGKPISVEKVSNPTVDQIQDLHAKYCNELENLYNKYKDEFWHDPNTSPPKLELLENPLR